jgi:hypothetical protein
MRSAEGFPLAATRRSASKHPAVPAMVQRFRPLFNRKRKERLSPPPTLGALPRHQQKLE